MLCAFKMITYCTYNCQEAFPRWQPSGESFTYEDFDMREREVLKHRRDLDLVAHAYLWNQK